MANERKTEDMVDARLRQQGYFRPRCDITVEKQITENPRIAKLLRNASKTGNGNGRPEFIIHSAQFTNFLIVIECKADATKHESANRDRYADFAVDGVLLYAAFLAKEFDVLAIAVSGQTEG